MNKDSVNRNEFIRFIHLYNPKKEGLGAYDIHYINAQRNNKRSRLQKEKQKEERYAA